MNRLQLVNVFIYSVLLLLLHTEDVDYISGPYSVIFPKKMDATLNISINNDAVSEGVEIFGVRIDIDTLLPKDVNINVGAIGRTTVTVMDTTGECCSSSKSS